VKLHRIFPKLFVLAAMFSIQSPGAGPRVVDLKLDADEDGLVFVYVHGFGGAKKSPEFCENLQAFLDEEEVAAQVLNYEWDSVKVDPLKAGASWLKAQAMADEEASKFKLEVIDKLDAENREYVVVGFSVGSRVVLKALEESDKEWRGLRGVYFLGSAMTKDMTLERRSAMPEGMKITNYHSPKRDLVHRMAFNFMSEVSPGGQVGFDDVDVFENYPVSCAHAHKGVGVTIDYSGLAEAIAFLELHEAGLSIEGSTKLNWETPVMEGDYWWNRIHVVQVDGIGAVELEQHTMRPGYYRALRVDGEGKRTRIARGENLHAILRELGVAE
jgi:pimeloyl-ACP methyl ester carboxylesterase